MSMIEERPGTPGDSPAPSPATTKLLAGETAALIGPLLLGILLAVTWRLLLPTTESFGDEQEAAAAVDGTLIGLGLFVGVVIGVVTLLRPGASPVRRVLVVLITSTIGAAISWGLGNQLGTPHLRALGAAFVWPATTAVVIMVGAILPWTSRRLEP
ncbi:hypothetical protein [Kineosporia sp. NBRC 101731]|uniref:hypothetical protein n=1 Tax=Kineosporia sp. NBRC 101731 TaxID=3032199 RepID=UPI0024A54021|nr:hypothetical protein [Kineosporia sp. NBRC 101731]GLY33734.1 hypothetical protein Kisp02_70990 [Kineosporia sp. NBRC 101731]